MKKYLYFVVIIMGLSGCTQIITAPISVAGAVVETTIDIGAAGVRAVVGSDDEEEDD